MKKLAGILFLSLAVSFALGWMLATPGVEINGAVGAPALADGGQPMPPPPFSFVGGTNPADGGQPMPPPPFASSTLLADGGQPMPPPPFSFVGGTNPADGGQPMPPPPFSA